MKPFEFIRDIKLQKIDNFREILSTNVGKSKGSTHVSLEEGSWKNSEMFLL